MKKLFAKRFWICTAILILSFELFFPKEAKSAEEPVLAPVISNNKVSVSYTQDTLDQGFTDWRMVSTAISHQFDFGSLIGRLNQAHRFDSDGNQFEIDSYPHLREGTYAYLNIGYSKDSIFPKYRFGAEIYQNLGQAWEASLGFRKLIFQNSTVTIWTGTVAKYIGNYYLVLRINTVPDEAGNSISYGPQVRRYFGDHDYVGISAGSGRSPTQVANDSRVLILVSKRISLEAQFEIKPTWGLTASLGDSEDEIREGVVRRDQSFSLGLEKTF